MELSTVQEVLLSILAAALALFLALSIVIAVFIIRILKTINVITDKAERFVESAEAVGDVLRNASGPIGVFRFLHGVMEASKRKKDDK